MNEVGMEAFDYNLPEERIAQFPLKQRSDSKLLCFRDGEIANSNFKQLPNFLPEQCRIIFNNTKVINARIFMHRSTGAKIQLFLLNPISPAEMETAMKAKGSASWKAMVGGGKRWKIGERLSLSFGQILLEAERVNIMDETSEVKFTWSGAISFAEVLDHLGNIPLPPYMKREVEESDFFRYQTTYAEVVGSVAAPTAGLHFDDKVLEELSRKQIKTSNVTLHVGAGTFKPVTSDDFREHRMHAEQVLVTKQEIRQLAKKETRICVGTTSLRSLESLYWFAVRMKLGDAPRTINQWDPYELNDRFQSYEEAMNFLYENMTGEAVEFETEIMITPEYRIKSVDAMITNFHLPKSTLLLLVHACIQENWKKVYSYALEHDYRFLSFGDSSLLWVQK